MRHGDWRLSFSVAARRLIPVERVVPLMMNGSDSFPVSFRAELGCEERRGAAARSTAPLTDFTQQEPVD